MENQNKVINEKNRKKISRLWSNVRLFNLASLLSISGLLIVSIVNKDILTIQSTFFFYCFTFFMFCSSLSSRDALHISKVETLLQDIQEIERKHLDYRINRRKDEDRTSQEFRVTPRRRTFQQVVIYIEAPDALPILDMVSTLEKLVKTLRCISCDGEYSLNGFHLWDFVPTGIRLSVTSAVVSESSGFFREHCGDEIDEGDFRQALWSVEHNPRHNSISVLLQEVSGVPTFYFGSSINKVCESLRSGEVRAAKYDNGSGYSFILHLS